MSGESTSSSQKAADSAGNGFQNKFAMTVFLGSILGIILIGLAGIWQGKLDAKEAFQSTLPLFGTWVGTVLAYYFARQNFESASASLNQVVQNLTPDQKLSTVKVTDIMIGRREMVVLTLEPGQTDDSVPLTSLQALFADKTVTRLPILNTDGSIRYVVHESVLSKYLARGLADGTLASPSRETMANFLSAELDGEPIRRSVRLYALVQEGASLADAQTAMRAINGCQDVFVTAKAIASEPVLGWVTNAAIARRL